MAITHDTHSAIRYPLITEKNTDLAVKGTYCFAIASEATKHDVARAIKKIYGVTPRLIRVSRIPAKKTRNRKGIPGIRPGIKKAFVYLKKGDSIEFV